MPWKVVESEGGYFVEDDKGKRYSKKPMSRKNAVAQLRALYANNPEERGKEVRAQVLTRIKSVGSKIESAIHTDFTNRADDWYGNELLTREERIILSSAIGDALDKFVKRIEKDAPQLYTRGLSDAIPQPFIDKELSPSLVVYKDSTGADRWVLFSSNAYRDRDREIVSTAALETDVARADKEQNYGPLRWWHVGKPDPISQTAGPGLDLGVCDFNAMHGRTLIESGTFYNSKIAQAVKEAAPGLQVSIGYFHPRTEPDSTGVFNQIKRFERSLLPAGRASNPFTAMTVIQKSIGGTEMISEKIKAFAALLKDDELVQSILSQAEAKEKEADAMLVDFKEQTEAEPEAPASAPAQPAEMEVKAEEVTEQTEADEPEEEYQPTIGDMSADAFAGMLAEAMDTALEPYRKELKAVQTGMKQKDDSEAALREALELQAQTIATVKSQLDELTGSQPRAATKGYRDSQSAETVVKDDSRVKGKQPTIDPDFVKMFLP